MTFNITTNGSTPIALSPASHYMVVVEGTFSGATVAVQSAGGVIYLPWREGQATIATADASEFRAVSATGEIVVANAAAGTDLNVQVTKVNPTC